MRGKVGEAVSRLTQKRLFLLDMDGTIYLGDRLFPATIPFLEAVKRRGGRYIFATNNSSRSVEDYVRRLEGMGLAVGREDFLTSVDVLIHRLKRLEKSYSLCYVMGTRSFLRQLEEAGIPVTDRLEDGVDCLLAGFDRELTFQKLEDACRLLVRGVDFWATNPDWVCPTEFGAVPDCGSVCEMLRRATGRSPRVVGKPEPDMAMLAMEKTGWGPEETLVIGDRLYTDIACGINAGVDTALVLSGETRAEDLADSPWRPAWVWRDIGEYLEEVERE